MRPRILIYVPGFPGEAIPRLPGERRVVDVVSDIASHRNLELEIVSYPGIKNSEQFTFEKTLSHTLKVIQEKTLMGYSITLIGQSWGGLISLLAVNQFAIDRLALITPFLISPSEEDVTAILGMYSNEFPSLISSEAFSGSATSVVKIFEGLNELRKKENIITDVRVLVANQDEVVPANGLVEFFSTTNIFKNPATLFHINNDHDFSLGKDELTEWLKQNV
jgi:alpha-beta hydrolase superfamily lysophospholipase